MEVLESLRNRKKRESIGCVSDIISKQIINKNRKIKRNGE